MAIDHKTRRALQDAYRQAVPPMGIYQIRNLDNGKIFVDASRDLRASRNRHQFVSTMRRAVIPELQVDWHVYGGTRFVFEVLDELTPPPDAVGTAAEVQARCREELSDLLALWLDKLQPYGDRGYNRQRPAPAR